MKVNNKINDYTNRLLMSRLRILSNHGFYGLLLMHAKFGLDTECETAYTDGEKICFSPTFMDELSPSELDFIMMHEILHMALRHCVRLGEENHYIANIACDIVVNSNIMHSCNDDIKAITLKKYGTSMHLTPNREEGYLFTAEQVYDMLVEKIKKDIKNKKLIMATGDDIKDALDITGIWDDHSKWSDKDDQKTSAEWNQHLQNAAQSIKQREEILGRGMIPSLALRKLDEINESQIDWRQILQDFIQVQACDYSFSPPDRRFPDSPFFLPDFNDTENVVNNILFMIDTSSSMSDKMISVAFNEIKCALEQFNGKLTGWVGFFDSDIIPPKPFTNMDELKIIKAYGGGGTSFDCIFDYIKKERSSSLPQSIIILTDGFAPYPPKEKTLSIPVLWIINNKTSTPPYGKIARIK